MIHTAGKIKQKPATINPLHPALSRPICMAISVLLGPGIKLVAPIKSRKCSSLIHCLLITTSWRIMAICAAGPPNPMTPSFKNSLASSDMSLEILILQSYEISEHFSFNLNYRIVSILRVKGWFIKNQTTRKKSNPIF